MKTLDAIAHFGSAARVADALGISRAAVSRWGERIPPSSASLLEKLSGGALVFDPADYLQDRPRSRHATDPRVAV